MSRKMDLRTALYHYVDELMVEKGRSPREVGKRLNRLVGRALAEVGSDAAWQLWFERREQDKERRKLIDDLTPDERAAQVAAFNSLVRGGRAPTDESSTPQPDTPYSGGIYV